MAEHSVSLISQSNLPTPYFSRSYMAYTITIGTNSELDKKDRQEIAGLIHNRNINGLWSKIDAEFDPEARYIVATPYLFIRKNVFSDPKANDQEYIDQFKKELSDILTDKEEITLIYAQGNRIPRLKANLQEKLKDPGFSPASLRPNVGKTEDNNNNFAADPFEEEELTEIRETTVKTKKAYKAVEISGDTFARAFLIIPLAGAYLFRESKLGWAFAAGAAAVATFNGLTSDPKPKSGVTFGSFVSIPLPLRLATALEKISTKLGSGISLSATFGTALLSQLVVVHYVLKPLASRSVPVLSGWLAGALQEATRYPMAAPVTLLAISSLFTLVARSKK